MKEALFDEIRHISIQKIKSERMNLQKLLTRPTEKRCSHLYLKQGLPKTVMEKLEHKG